MPAFFLSIIHQMLTTQEAALDLSTINIELAKPASDHITGKLLVKKIRIQINEGKRSFLHLIFSIKGDVQNIEVIWRLEREFVLKYHFSIINKQLNKKGLVWNKKRNIYLCKPERCFMLPAVPVSQVCCWRLEYALPGKQTYSPLRSSRSKNA